MFEKQGNIISTDSSYSHNLSDWEAVVQRGSTKKMFLKISQKFTGNHLCWTASAGCDNLIKNPT